MEGSSNLLRKMFEFTFKIGVKAQELEQTLKEGKIINGRGIWGSIESRTGQFIDIVLKDLENLEILKNLKDLKDLEDLEDLEDLKYNDNHDLYKEMSNTITIYKMDNNEMNPKSNHFFMQLMNLVIKKSQYKIKLNKILQLAFNAAQLKVFIDKWQKDNKDNKDEKYSYTNDITKIFNKYKLDSLDTYVSIETQEKINEMMNFLQFKFDFEDIDIKDFMGHTDKQSGGFNDILSLKHKLLKYKTKISLLNINQ